MQRILNAISALAAILFLVGQASAQVTLAEIEPNTTKAQATANGPFILASGDALTGTSTGSVISPANSASNTVDMFLAQTASAPLGIYRHAIQLAAAPSGTHQGTIRGLSQSGGAVTPGTDSLVQVSLSTGLFPRTNVWYGFGKGEQIYYRVSGQSATTSPYTATLATTAVTPTAIGTFLEGSLILAGTTAEDTEIWIYDANLDVIPGYGNDNIPQGTPALLIRSFAPGTYYLAISRSNLANNQPDPPDSTGTGPVLDFPNAAASGNSIIGANLSFAVADCTNVVFTNATNALLYEVMWFTFTVLPKFKLVLSQPGGPGAGVVFTNSGGVAGRLYLNGVTLNQGLFPAGWFFGVDIPYLELATEFTIGAPFFGVLGPQGGASNTVPGPIPSGITVYGVGIEIDPLTFLPVTICGAAFSYTTL